MKLSSYVRVWLDNGKGPRIKETSDYVKSLETEIKKLKMSDETSIVCPRCWTRARKQNVENGEFYFCPNEKNCGQGRLSVSRMTYRSASYLTNSTDNG
jgi:hypothetical protein